MCVETICYFVSFLFALDFYLKCQEKTAKTSDYLDLRSSPIKVGKSEVDERGGV